MINITNAKIVAFGFIVTSLLYSCASLTKSQLNQVNQFGQLTQNFSAYPSKVVSAFNQAHVQIELYRANSLSTPAEHYKAIVIAHNFKQATDIITPKIDIALQIINKYAQSLVLLTSDGNTKSLDTASLALGANIDVLTGKYNTIETNHPLPTGLGGAIGKLIDLTGGLYIRTQQAEAVKKLVPQADPIIQQLCKQLLAFLQEPLSGNSAGNISLEKLLANEKEQLKDNYTKYLGLNRDMVTLVFSKDSTSRLSGPIVNQRFALLSDDRECLQQLENLDDAEQLRKQCIAAVTNLAKAHAKLVEEVNEKKKLTDIVAEVQYYGNDIQQMNTTIKAIKYQTP